MTHLSTQSHCKAIFVLEKETKETSDTNWGEEEFDPLTKMGSNRTSMELGREGGNIGLLGYWWCL